MGSLSFRIILSLTLICTVLPASAQQPIRRFGVSGSPLSLGLRDAVLMAIENNPAIRIARLEIESRDFESLGSRGAFDPRIGINGSFLSDTVPVASILAGGEEGLVSTDRFDGSFELDQQLPFGARWSALFESARSSTSNLFTQLDPQYPSSWLVDFELPLLRNRSIDAARLGVQIASVNVHQSEAELERETLDLLTSVREAYWELFRAREAVGVVDEAVELARAQVERNRRLVEAGEAAEVDVIEAEASYQRRQGELFSAYEEVTIRENALKKLILGNRTAALWSREILTTDRSEVGPQMLGIDEAWAMASSRRPEFEVLRRQQETQQLTTSYLENQTKPAVDLFASYGSYGLAGSERPGGNPFGQQNQILQERVNLLSGFHDLAPLPPSQSGGVPDNLLGNLGQSLSNLLTQDFRTGAVGVRLEIPIFNRTAKGELGTSQVRERQLEASQRDLEQSVEAEIRNALQALQSSQQRLEAARAARQASQARLESEQRLFEAGETTTFLVLTRQALYAENRGTEVRAEMDLNIAVARLHRAIGNAMEVFNVAVKRD